jgi:hypothetical protein
VNIDRSDEQVGSTSAHGDIPAPVWGSIQSIQKKKKKKLEKNQ